MSNIRKLSAFRQLSLNCSSPTPEQRRKTLKKQFSEDLPDARDSWLDPGIGIKISINAKASRNLDHRPPIRIAWDDNPELKSEEAVIIKKCKEVRRASTGKLSRQSSTEKDSIFHPRQELTDRLRQVVKEREQEKPNLEIYLAHNSKEQNDEFYNNQMIGDPGQYSEKAYEIPKLIQPLVGNVSSNNKNLFQIRKKIRPKINLAEIAYSPTRYSDSSASICRNNTVVVVPIVEREETTTPSDTVEDSQCDDPPVDERETDDIKPIDSIIIRPSTAASRREKFQKRTNSAFHATIKEPSLSRPPLIRSSSAPSKQDHGKPKFLANKRKIKSAKRAHIKSHAVDDDIEDNNSNKENPKTQKELNRTTAVIGSEVITMVSLVSPAGSDVEDEIVEKHKEKCKSKSNPTHSHKNTAREEKEPPKNLSLRKTVKSVSFQQSSIHAIRSFSASFPARRSSMATAIMLGNNAKPTPHGQKVQEKRCTNSKTPDDDERVPKRRLVRSNTEEPKTISCERPETAALPDFTGGDEEKRTSNANFSVDIKSKSVAEVAEPAAPDVPEVNPHEAAAEVQAEEGKEIREEAKYESPKEKQCWDMYCKMTEKGINVTFDTILRGMLTPTEYRMSRKNSIVVPDDADAPDPC